MATDWRSAHFKQAASDYQAYTLLSDPKRLAPVCQRLHYLQMTTEKLAKGFLTPADGPRPRRTHLAFKGFVQSIKSNPRLQRVCHCGPTQIRPFVDSLLYLAEKIENLAPIGDADKPNPECPWEATTAAGSTIIVPNEYDFPELRFNDPKMVKLIELIDRCFQLIGETL